MFKMTSILLALTLSLALGAYAADCGDGSAYCKTNACCNKHKQ